MRKLLVLSGVLAFAVPGFALAQGKPSDPSSTTTTTTTTTSSHSKAAPQVMYVLKGIVTNYSAASGSTDGTLTLTVKRANRHGTNLTAYLKNDSLSFAVSATTKVVLHNGAAVANGDQVIVKVRGPKTAAAFAAATNLKAFQLIDQGAPAAS